jgi:hypothetical protein
MPATLRPAAAPKSITAALRRIIAEDGLTAYGLSMLTAPGPGMTPRVANPVISRFLKGERTITLETLDALAEALSLTLVRVAVRRKGGRP